MTEIVTEISGSSLRVQLNRPDMKNALTSSMYMTLADLLNSAAKDDGIRVVLLHGAGDSFHGRQRSGGFRKESSRAR